MQEATAEDGEQHKAQYPAHQNHRRAQGRAPGCDPGTRLMNSSLRSFYSSNRIQGLHAAFRQAGELQGVEGRSCQGKKKKKTTRERLTSLVLLTAKFSEGNPATHYPGDGRGPQALPPLAAPLPARANRPRPWTPPVPLKEDHLRKQRAAVRDKQVLKLNHLARAASFHRGMEITVHTSPAKQPQQSHIPNKAPNSLQ